MLSKYKKTIKRVFFVPAAIVGAGVFGVAVGGMAVLGGIVTVCYITESIIETTVDTVIYITSLMFESSIVPVATLELDVWSEPETLRSNIVDERLNSGDEIVGVCGEPEPQGTLFPEYFTDVSYFANSFDRAAHVYGVYSVSYDCRLQKPPESKIIDKYDMSDILPVAFAINQPQIIPI